MHPVRHINQSVVVVDDLWAELGVPRQMAWARAPLLSLCFSRPWRQSLAAAGLMVLLHGVLGVGLFGEWGGPNVSAVGDSRTMSPDQRTGNEVISVLILVPAQADALSNDAQSWPATEGVSGSVEPQALPVMDSASGGESAERSGGTVEGMESRTLQDIYLGQIRARVERAWSDSQGIHLGIGACQVIIRQGERGQVQDVRFDRCIANAAWKNTLTQAIHFASPLPTPPQAAVFSREIHLEF